MALTIIERNVQLDLYDHDLTPSKIKAIALDSKTRYVGAEIHNGGQTYDVGQNTGVTLTVIRPDKTGVQVTGSTFQYTVGEGETVYGAYAELTQTALAVSGTLLAQFMLTSGEQILRTEIFTINNGVALDAEVSEWAGEYQGYNLDELVQNVNEAVAKVDAMEQDVSELKSGLSDLDGRVEALEEGGAGRGLTEEVKVALLQIAQKVAYVDAQGQDYYDDLYGALYPPKTLMRISAVYAQDDIVFTTDNLSVLKTDLTVYALYDDGSKEVVPDANYTLSGALTEGTSTITVTYSGKTTAFNVTVTASAYTHYDYIADSYTGQRYPTTWGILTDIGMTSEYTFKTKLRFTKTYIEPSALCGSRNGQGGAKQFALFRRYNGQIGYWFDTVDTAVVINAFGNLNTLYDVEVNPVGKSEEFPENATITVNDVVYDTGATVTGKTWNNWLAFFNYGIKATAVSAYEPGNSGMQLGRTVIVDGNGNTIHDIRPATDGTLCGLHDIITDEFYYDSANAEYYNVGNW